MSPLGPGRLVPSWSRGSHTLAMRSGLGRSLWGLGWGRTSQSACDMSEDVLCQLVKEGLAWRCSVTSDSSAPAELQGGNVSSHSELGPGRLGARFFCPEPPFTLPCLFLDLSAGITVTNHPMNKTSASLSLDYL